MQPKIKLVVFDWAGTVIDHGCMAPVAAFVKLFEAHGVKPTVAKARAPMGLEKRDHIRAMIQEASLAAAWREAHGRAWTEDDVDMLYREFVPIQMAALEENSRLVPGALEALELLRSKGIKVAGTTGYFEAAAKRVEEIARGQGFVVDSNAWAESGTPGRPAPWMIFKNMERLNVYPPAQVLKIGDTVHDIMEGLNAGARSSVVLRAGSEIGLSASEYDGLNPETRSELLNAARLKMMASGAHDVIESLADLAGLLV